MTIAPEPRRPNPVDLHVGGCIRMRRKLMGVSQEQLADALGLTFQQVQKYERGSNRVSASKLYMVARTLGVPIAFFFAGLPDPGDGDHGGDGQYDPERKILEFLGTSDGLELARLFPQLPRGPARRQLLDLVRAMAETNDDD